jgi:hypothetical protein
VFYPLSHSSILFYNGFLQDRGSWTICSDWIQAMILLIAASRLQITDMSYRLPASWCFLTTDTWLRSHRAYKLASRVCTWIGCAEATSETRGLIILILGSEATHSLSSCSLRNYRTHPMASTGASKVSKPCSYP